MLSELEVLKDVCARLETARIPYMLTGSMAMNYYAQPRMTRDIDIVVALEGADAGKLIASFEPDYFVPEEALKAALREQGMFNLLHLESVVKVDLIVRKQAPYRQTEFARRVQVQLPGFSAWLVSREDLILSKLAWAKDCVNDTSPEIARMVHERYARMEPVQRFMIGVNMFEAARAIAQASFPADLSPEQLRRTLCERFYPGLAAQAYGVD